MSMVQAIEMGRRSNELEPMKLIDPGQALNAMTNASAINTRAPAVGGAGGATRIAGRGRASSPMEVWDFAAKSTLMEAQLRKEKAAAEALELANETKRNEEMRNQELHRQKVEAGEVAIGTAKDTAIQTRFKSGMENAAGYNAQDAASRSADTKKAVQQAMFGRTEGLVNLINQGGDPNTNVQSIEKSPNGKEFIVTPSNGKPFVMDDRKFYAWANGFDPKVLESIANISKGEVALATKTEEVGIKRDTLALAKQKERAAEWDRANNPLNLPLTEAQKVAREKAIGAPAAPGPTPEPGQGQPAIQTQRGKVGQPPAQEGEAVRGKVPENYYDGKPHVSPKDGKSYQWDAEVSKFKEVESEAAPQGKAKTEGRGSVIYTDPDTGEKMKAVVMPDGTVKKEALNTEKQEGKEKKDKKKETD